MPDLLLELFSEEIPARMQAKAADDLRRMVTDKLVAEGLVYEGAKAFATPRRLALTVHGIPARQADLKEERKGPRVGGPEAAIAGFLKATGLSSLDEAKIQSDPKKGDFYVALIDKPGRATIEVLAEILPVIIRTFPWPKSMRWGARSARSGSLSWVRPLHAITATFGLETEEPDVVKFAVDGIEAGQTTFGHRFMAPQAISVRRFEDYEAKLLDARVVLDAERRKDAIVTDARTLAQAQNFELVEDQVLLEEVSGLVEWPVVLMGSFDESFLSIPPEVIRATIRANQKCFVLRTGDRLANRFIVISNIEATDGGKEIVAGNKRVVAARLADAKFFWETDLGTKLEDRLPKLESIIFHQRLGTQGERVRRLETLADEIATRLDAGSAAAAHAAQAAHLCKADLVSEMVGEFPELQGLMGRYYALAQHKHPSVAAAIGEHYKPQGPGDRVPTDPVSVAVALADKIDTLVGFWAINEKPTGSKDPYALRRAALGVIRLVLENGLRLSLLYMFRFAQSHLHMHANIANDLLSFFADRLKVYLRDKGARHDLIDAVFALDGQDDLLMIVKRVEALGKLLETDDGGNLLAGYKRAANILRAEEKRDGAGAFEAKHTAGLLAQDEERALARAIARAASETRDRAGAEDFEGAMQALARLRAPVDAFFDKVTVNAEDAGLRLNRLRLLNELRAAMHEVADFSKVAG